LIGVTDEVTAALAGRQEVASDTSQIQNIIFGNKILIR